MSAVRGRQWVRNGRVALFAVAAVVLVACGGSGDDDAGSTSSTEAASTSTSTSTTEASADADNDVSSSTTTDSGSDGSSGTPTTHRGGGGDTTAFRRPDAGRYTYRVSGSSTFGTTKQELPPSATLTVTNLSERDQRHVLSAGDAETTSSYRFTDAAVLLLSLKTAQGGVTKEFRPQPPVVYAPLPPTVGERWHWKIRSTDGATTVEQTSRVVRTERRTVGGTVVDTYVVETVVTLSGDINATTRQTSWATPTHGLVVRTEQTTNGTFGALSFSSRSTSQLASLRPA